MTALLLIALGICIGLFFGALGAGRPLVNRQLSQSDFDRLIKEEHKR